MMRVKFKKMVDKMCDEKYLVISFSGFLTKGQLPERYLDERKNVYFDPERKTLKLSGGPASIGSELEPGKVISIESHHDFQKFLEACGKRLSEITHEIDKAEKDWNGEENLSI